MEQTKSNREKQLERLAHEGYTFTRDVPLEGGAWVQDKHGTDIWLKRKELQTLERGTQ
jgi:hypothetical protein